MVELKPGAKLRSAVDDTQVIVVKGVGETDLRCGGRPMLPADDETVRERPLPTESDGTLLGKRYTDTDSTIEVLCTKAGAGSLSIGDTPLQVARAKTLPASD